MSAYVQTALLCDGEPGCPASVEDDYAGIGEGSLRVNVRGTRGQARDAGWTTRRAPDGRFLDFCPECSKAEGGERGRVTR